MNVGVPVLWTSWVGITEGRGAGERSWFLLAPETGPTGGVRSSVTALWGLFLFWGGSITLPFFFTRIISPPAPSREPARCVLLSLARLCPA